MIEQDYKAVQTYPPERAHQQMLTHQFTRLTRDGGGALVKDDRLDALATAVTNWSEQTARDATTRSPRCGEHHLQEEEESHFTPGRRGEAGICG